MAKGRLYERTRPRFEGTPSRGRILRRKATAVFQLSPLRVQHREGVPIPERPLFDSATMGAEESTLVQVQAVIEWQIPITLHRDGNLETRFCESTVLP